MTRMKDLTRLMKELEEQLIVCMRCGMCQAVCPVFAQTGREADVARGKLALLDGLLKQMFDDPQGVYDRLNKCLLCGSCAANCPSGVSALEIFMKARAILTGFMGLPPAKKVILRGMLARPQLFDHLMEWGAKFQKVLTKPANEVVGTSCARFTSPLLEDRHFKNLAQVPFHKEVASLDGPAGRSGLKVAFFVGCLLDKFFPTIPRAALKILQHHEVGVFIPPHQGCCGIPAASAGDMPTFRRLLQHNLDCFEAGDFDYLITACATCTATIKDIWPVMVRGEQGDLHERVNRLTTKTVDINEFLIDQLGLAFSPPSSTKSAAIVTYHDPCHLSKSLGVATQPRALLDSNPSYRFKQMAGADSCCGLGGSFNLQYYQISSQIGRLKRDNIVATGCDVVATGCPACMLQISDMLSKAGDAVQIKHPIEIYAETIN